MSTEFTRAKARIIRERTKDLDGVKLPTVEDMRRLQGAFGCGEDKYLILWDLLKDYPELIEQVAALVVKAFERNPSCFPGPDPGDQAEEDAEDALNRQEYRRERAEKKASIAAYKAERIRVFESGTEEEREVWRKREEALRKMIGLTIDGLLSRDVA